MFCVMFLMASSLDDSMRQFGNQVRNSMLQYVQGSESKKKVTAGMYMNEFEPDQVRIIAEEQLKSIPVEYQSGVRGEFRKWFEKN